MLNEIEIIKSLARSWKMVEVFSLLNGLNQERLLEILEDGGESGYTVLHLAAFGYRDFFEANDRNGDLTPIFQLIMLGANPLAKNYWDDDVFTILSRNSETWELYSYILQLGEFSKNNPSFDPKIFRRLSDKSEQFEIFFEYIIGK